MTALDVPREQLEAEAREIWAERDRRVAALNFRAAAQRTNSPSDRLAFYLDALQTANNRAKEAAS